MLPGMGIMGTIGCILLCEAAGLVGAAFTRRSVRTWYPTLRKPWFTPPSWLFAPAWILLYVLMGISLSLAWSASPSPSEHPLPFAVFAAQLVVNAAWSFLFFGLRRPSVALAGIVLLWCLIVATILLFLELSTFAAALLVPYLLWVSFATLLNASIWKLNRGTH